MENKHSRVGNNVWCATSVLIDLRLWQHCRLVFALSNDVSIYPIHFWQPKLAEKLLGKQSSYGYVLEDSSIDARRRVMTTVTRNLSFARVMVVEEKCTYRVSDENPDWCVQVTCI